MSVRRQWILIGVIFAAGVVMIVLVPRFTGIDGRLVMVGGPPVSDGRRALDHRPAPNRTIIVTRPGSDDVVARAVTDADGRFSFSMEPGLYELSTPPLRPSPPPSDAFSPGAGPTPVSVGLFGHSDVELVILIR